MTSNHNHFGKLDQVASSSVMLHYHQHLEICLAEAATYFGSYHMERRRSYSSMPSGTEPHTRATAAP